MKNVAISAGVFLLRALEPLLRLVPPSWTVGMFAGIGRLSSYLCAREVAIAETQLQFAYREPTRNFRPLVRSIFAHVGETVAEVLLSDKLLPQPVGRPGPGNVTPLPCRHIETTDDDALIAGFNEGKGLVALGSHSANFELLAAYYGFCGVDMAVFGRRPNYQAVDNWLSDVRSKHHLETLWREDARSPFKILKALKRGAAICALLDQDVQLENRFSNFFGLPAASPIAPLKIAIKYRLPVVTSIGIRVDRLRLRAVTSRIEYDAGDGSEAATERALQTILDHYNQQVEEIVRQYPWQWLWWHRRWRRRPDIDYENHPEQLRSNREYLKWLSELA